MKKTIYDIAKELDLAPSTISKVLNNTGSVSQKTRARVQSHVKRVGYVATSNARILKSKKSWTIGIVFSDESEIGLEHPFFSSVLQSFKVYVEKKGYEIVFIVSYIGENKMSYLQWCRNKKVDGVLIVIGDINDKNIIELVNSEIPCVSTDISMNQLHSVYSDNESGMVQAFDYAEQLGFDKIAVIPGPLSAKAYLERFEAYEKLMAERNLSIRPGYIALARSYGFTSGFEAVTEMLEQVEELPEIILAGSDDIALGVIRGIEAKGYHVPNDISVIGFDDIHFAKHYTPALTTIRQDKTEIGVRSAQVLLDLIEQKDEIHPVITKIPVSLIVRDSTKQL